MSVLDIKGRPLMHPLLPLPRTCRLCHCTDEKACPGGCGWALDEVCTACVGHTPASWAAHLAARQDGDLADERPPMVCLISAASAAANAVNDITGFVSQQTYPSPDVARDALANLLLAAIDLIEAEGFPDEQMQLLGAIEKYREEAR